MSFDSVFHGAPTSVGGQSISSGRASLGIDAASGILYFRTPENAGWQECAGSSSGSSAWAALTGDLTETQVIPWDGPTVGTKDSGISRLAAGSLAIGNGTAGDFSGSLTLASLLVGSSTDTMGYAVEIHESTYSNTALYGHSSTSYNGPDLTFARTGGTQVSPTTILDGWNIGYNTYRGWNGSGYVAGAQITVIATENWTSSSNGAYYVMSASPSGETDTIGCLAVGFSGPGVSQRNSTLVDFGVSYTSVMAWTNGPVFNSPFDTSLSRLAAGSLAIGNGTAGDTSGQVTAKTYTLSDFGSVPTSTSGGGTAGTVGQLIQHSGILYFCSVTGVAGSATWNVITMTLSA
jgi:hypothetical protein